MVTVAVSEQEPLAAITEYETAEVGETVMEEAVEPVLHE